MGILRNEIKSNFTQIPNQLLFDNRLSFGSRILYCYLASKPDNWKIINQDVINTLQVSCDSIAKYFKELLNAGWITREREIDDKGQFCGGYNYTVYASPKPPNKEKVLIRQNDGKINNTNTTNNTNLFSNNNISINNKQQDNINNINNNIYNNKNKKDIDNNINNTQSNSIKLEQNDKLLYESYKKILETKDIDNIQIKSIKKAENLENGINMPKTEKDAKKEPKQKPNEEIGKDTKPKKRFVKPTIEQVREYVIEAKLTKVDPDAFYDHFESNGWKVSGISPMKDWKASVRNWNRRADSFNNSQKSNKNQNVFLEEYKRLEEEERNNKGE